MSFTGLSGPLLFALAAAVTALVVLVHLRRREPRRRVVSSVEFWRRAALRVPAATPRARRIPWRALLVSLAIALGLVLLLGEPRATAGGPAASVLVVDAGATLGAVDPAGHSAQSAACEEARAWAEDAVRAGPVAVVRAGQRPSIAAAFADEPAWIEAAVRALVPDEAAPDLEGAVALAQALLRARRGEGARAAEDALDPREDGVVVVLTDAPLAPSPGVTVRPLVGSIDDLGVAAFEARRVPGALGEYAVRVEVRANTARPHRARLSVRDGEAVILDEPIEVAADAPRALEARGFSRRATTLVASIEALGPDAADAPRDRGDGLPSNDRAFATLPPPVRPRVLVVGGAGRALAAALAAHPGLDVTRAPSIAPGDPRLREADVLVLDGAPWPEGLVHSAVLAIPRDSPPSEGPRAIALALAAHPALGGLRLDGFRVARWSAVDVDEGALVLLRAGDAPIVVAHEAGGRRAIRIGFDPDASELATSEVFPLFVDHAVRWLAGAAAIPWPPQVGDPLRASRALVDPAGLSRAPADVPALPRAGVWRVDGEDVAVAPAAGALAPRAQAPDDAPTTRPPAPPSVSLAAFLAALVAALSLVEWARTHRGGAS